MKTTDSFLTVLAAVLAVSAVIWSIATWWLTSGGV